MRTALGLTALSAVIAGCCEGSAPEAERAPPAYTVDDERDGTVVADLFEVIEGN